MKTGMHVIAGVFVLLLLMGMGIEPVSAVDAPDNEWHELIEIDPWGNANTFAQETSDGGYVVIAKDSIIKLNSQRILKWQYDLPDQFVSNYIQQTLTPDDNLVIAGFNEYSESIEIINIDKTGTPVWDKIYPREEKSTTDYGCSIEQTRD